MTLRRPSRAGGKTSISRAPHAIGELLGLGLGGGVATGLHDDVGATLLVRMMTVLRKSMSTPSESFICPLSKTWEEDLVDVGVGLLDFVEEQDAVGRRRTASVMTPPLP
jgi:hypothetical protein